MFGKIGSAFPAKSMDTKRSWVLESPGIAGWVVSGAGFFSGSSLGLWPSSPNV
jgi:hypothetical protein